MTKNIIPYYFLSFFLLARLLRVKIEFCRQLFLQLSFNISSVILKDPLHLSHFLFLSFFISFLDTPHCLPCVCVKLARQEMTRAREKE
jgi:hypothetical protein